jgi:hypothetical protein
LIKHSCFVAMLRLFRANQCILLFYVTDSENLDVDSVDRGSGVVAMVANIWQDRRSGMPNDKEIFTF